MSELNRRNFTKLAAGATIGTSVAGCTDDGSDGGSGEGDSGGDDLDSGERPVQWIAYPAAARDEQVNKYEEMTGIELSTTNNTIAETQQRVLGGESESLDAATVPTDSIGALIDNDMTTPMPVDELDNWNEEYISDTFLNPTERLSSIGAQAEVIDDIVYADDERTELEFPPYIYNFDAIGYNPEFVDDVSLWSALIDDQYEGRTIIGETAAITIPEVLMHLVDTDQVDAEVGELNNPSQDMMDAAVDTLVENKEAGQFRSTWEAYGESVTLLASEEAVLGDVWQPAALDVRREDTPCTYATMSDGTQGYRMWYTGIAALNPGARDRNNLAEVQALVNDVHWGAWFPGFVQQWGYSVPHYENEDLVRDGSDESGEGMGPEYYDWAYRGEPTYEPVEDPALFDPMEYEWSDEEGDPDPDGSVRDSGPIEERFDRAGFFQIWPDEAEYMTERWRDFLAA